MPHIFSDEDMDKIKTFLNDKVKNPECYWCGETEWEHSSGLVHVEEFCPELRDRSNRHTYPMLIMGCKSCGNTLFFNASALDFIEESWTA